MIVDERLSARARADAKPQQGALRLLRLHAIWAPLLYIPYLFGANALAAGGGGVLLDRTLGDDSRPVVLVNAPGFLPVHFFTAKRRWFHEPNPAIDLLYGGAAELELTRVGEQALQLSAAGSSLTGGAIGTGRAASSNPLHVGDVIPSVRMRTQILEVKDGAPTRVRFDFSEPLNNVRVYAWQGRRLQLLPLPQLGAQTHIPAASAL